MCLPNVPLHPLRITLIFAWILDAQPEQRGRTLQSVATTRAISFAASAFLGTFCRRGKNSISQCGGEGPTVKRWEDHLPELWKLQFLSPTSGSAFGFNVSANVQKRPDMKHDFFRPVLYVGLSTVSISASFQKQC